MISSFIQTFIESNRPLGIWSERKKSRMLPSFQSSPESIQMTFISINRNIHLILISDCIKFWISSSLYEFIVMHEKLYSSVIWLCDFQWKSFLHFVKSFCFFFLIRSLCAHKLVKWSASLTQLILKKMRKQRRRMQSSTWIPWNIKWVWNWEKCISYLKLFIFNLRNGLREWVKFDCNVEIKFFVRLQI